MRDTAVDPDPDPEADGIFLDDAESEVSATNNDSAESMVVVLSSVESNNPPASSNNMNTNATSSSNSNAVSLQSPLGADSTIDTSGVISTSNLKTPVSPPSETIRPTLVTAEPVVLEAVPENSKVEEPIPRTVSEAPTLSETVQDALLTEAVQQFVSETPSVALAQQQTSTSPIMPEPSPVITEKEPERLVEVVGDSSSLRTGALVTSISVVPQDVNQNEDQEELAQIQRSSVLETRHQHKLAREKMAVSFHPATILSYPVIVEPESGYVDEDDVKPTPTPTGPNPPVIPGPGILPQPNDDVKNPKSTCQRCGQQIDAADTKIIPTQKVIK